MSKRKQYNHPLAEVADALANTKAAETASQRVSDGVITILERLFGKAQGNSAYDMGKQAREQWEQQGNDPYAILGLTRDADWEVVKSSYRALAKKYHPDSGRNPDGDMMTKINDAYGQIKQERGYQ